MEKNSLTFLIATYNNKVGIISLLGELQSHFPNASIVVVCDGSDSDHWEALCAYPKNPKIKKLQLTRNFGQHAALIAGMNHCESSLLITLDDDHSVLVPYVSVLLKAFQDSSLPVIYAEFGTSYPLWRRLGRFAYRCISMLWGKNHGRGSSVRLLTKPIYESLSKVQYGFHFIDECLTWYTKKIGFVIIPISLPKAKKSRYRLRTLMRLTFEKIFYASEKSLRYFMLFSFFAAFVNLLVGSIMLYQNGDSQTHSPSNTLKLIGVFYSIGFLLLGTAFFTFYLRKSMLRLGQTQVYQIEKIEP
jgi:glycosyltransferase involved in cell wall biosynthesis